MCEQSSAVGQMDRQQIDKCHGWTDEWRNGWTTAGTDRLFGIQTDGPKAGMKK